MNPLQKQVNIGRIPLNEALSTNIKDYMEFKTIDTTNATSNRINYSEESGLKYEFVLAMDTFITKAEELLNEPM